MLAKDIESPKNIVFFYKKKHTIAGSLLMYLNMAKYISVNRSEYTVYYINYYNEYINRVIDNTTIIFRDFEQCTYNDLDNSIFIVPLNYIQILLEKIRNLKNVKILLIDWHPYLVEYLINQFDSKCGGITPVFQLFQDTNSLCFMDKSCRASVERQTTLKYSSNYVPVFIDQSIKRYQELPIIDSHRLQIGWLGRLDRDKICTIINLADNLIDIGSYQQIDLHIIGDGDAKNALNIAKYTPKIRFIFTSYLTGDDLYDYLKKNVDLLVAMGMSALNGAELGIPTVIPLVSNNIFYTNKYVFLYDSSEYSLGWRKEDLKECGCKAYTIEEIITMTNTNELKVQKGLLCNQYLLKYHNIELAVECFFSCIEKTSLNVEKCLKCEPLKRQQEEFQCLYARDHHIDFEDYITTIQQRNRLYSANTYEKIKYYIKNIIWEGRIKKLLLLLKKRLTISSYQQIQRGYEKKVLYIKKQVKESHQLKVAFIVIFESVFPARPIFEKMLQDKMFDPYIIVSADVQRGIDHQLRTYHDSLQFFKKKYHERVIPGYDEEWDLFLELKDDYPIVFFANPYSKMAHPYHEISYFLNRNVLTLYVNYGFAAIKYGRTIMQLDFYNYIWKVFLDSEINRKDLKKYQPIKARNAVVTSYIKMDELADIKIEKRIRKRILICPHHTVLGWKSLDISNFLKYADFFIDLPQCYPTIDFIFRPHPLLFNNLVSNNIWTEKEVEDYLQRMLLNPNVSYDTSGDYFETFMNSDGMIHDCSSFIGEYLFTEKPCCYMLKDQAQIEDVFLPMGKMCMSNYYKAFTKEDIQSFIDEVIIKGIDPLKKEREHFSRTILKFNYPHSSEFVISYLKDQLSIN